MLHWAIFMAECLNISTVRSLVCVALEWNKVWIMCYLLIHAINNNTLGSWNGMFLAYSLASTLVKSWFICLTDIFGTASGTRKFSAFLGYNLLGTILSIITWCVSVSCFFSFYVSSAFVSSTVEMAFHNFT